MRHVLPTFHASAFRRGQSLEQFMGGGFDGEDQTVRWLELRPTDEGVEVWEFEVVDVGDIEFTDVSEFASIDLEAPPVAILPSAPEALEFAHRQLGASPERWVNSGVVGDEYRDYVLAGRPLQWPLAGT